MFILKRHLILFFLWFVNRNNQETSACSKLHTNNEFRSFNWFDLSGINWCNETNSQTDIYSRNQKLLKILTPWDDSVEIHICSKDSSISDENHKYSVPNYYKLKHFVWFDWIVFIAWRALTFKCWTAAQRKPKKGLFIFVFSFSSIVIHSYLSKVYLLIETTESGHSKSNFSLCRTQRTMQVKQW